MAKILITPQLILYMVLLQLYATLCQANWYSVNCRRLLCCSATYNDVDALEFCRHSQGGGWLQKSMRMNVGVKTRTCWFSNETFKQTFDQVLNGKIIASFHYLFFFCTEGWTRTQTAELVVPSLPLMYILIRVNG